jgi:hypothetical protein
VTLKNMLVGRTLPPIVLSAFMLGAAFFTGIASGLSGTASPLLINHIAFTAVISSEVDGLKDRPYEGYDTVKSALARSIYNFTELSISSGLYARTFRDKAALNAGLREASTVNTCGSGLVMHPANDQGMIDFTRGAFQLFGIDVTSLYYFFFLLVSGSALLFVWSHWRSYPACVLLFACVCAIYAFMPSVVYTDPQLLSVGNPRFLSTVAIIPLFHILLFLVRPGFSVRWQDLMALIGQTALLAFAYAIRNSTIWMTATLGLVFAVLIARPALQAWRTRSLTLRAETMTRCAVVMVFVATLFGISGFRSIYLTSPCGASLNSHVMWHNIFFGLSFNPEWRARFGADYDYADGDDLSFVAAKKYAVAHHLPYQTEPSIWVNNPETQSIMDEPMPFGSWQVYEKVMRAAVIEFALRNPGFTLKTFFIYKPARFFNRLENTISLMWNDLTPLKTAVAAFMLVLLAGLQGRRHEADAVSYPLTAVLVTASFIMSAAPSFVAYPASSLISDQVYVAVALMIFCSVWIPGSILALLGPRASAARPECEAPSLASP